MDSPLNSLGSSQRLRRERSSELGSMGVRETEVRRNTLRAIARNNPSNQARNAFRFAVVLGLPEAFGLGVCAGLFWHEECEDPLATWTLIEGVRILGSVLLSYKIYRANRAEDVEREQYLRKISTFLSFFALIWCVVGSSYIFDSRSNCSEKAPHIFKAAMAAVILAYIYAFLPCIIALAMLPVICCCLPCLISVLSRFSEAAGGAPGGANTAQLSTLSSIPYEEGMFEDEEDGRCAICIEEYQPGDRLRRLPCEGQHHFHADCVDSWLKLHATCPNCRFEIFADSAAATPSTPLNRGRGNERLDVAGSSGRNGAPDSTMSYGAGSAANVV